MQFAPFTSDIELPFYISLASHKINHDKLDDSARKLLGLYEIRWNDPPASSCRMQVLGNALTSDDTPAGLYRAEGIIKNFNTIEDFRNADKTAALNRAGKIIWEAIVDGTIYSCPSLLSSFHVLSFADLKKYKFTYWFAFPALHSDPSWKIRETESGGKVTKLSPNETTLLVEKVQTWRYGTDSREHGFFLAKRFQRSTSAPTDASPATPTTQYRDGLPIAPETGFGCEWVIGPLSSFEQGFFQNVAAEDRFVSFADPSTFPENPGWMLRNFLVLIRQRWKLDEVQILCYRDTQVRRDESRSIILNLKIESPAGEPASPQIAAVMPKVTGWERNKAGKATSKLANLAEYLDPTRLADQSVDLNLKLMKWRIAPTLNLDRIKNTRCLLLGAGTLGSYVSRNLLGWGVRKVTFVDNGTVSFSNPVRQPLFNFVDCLEGGAPKAPRAAEALKQIYPGVESSGHRLSVPMLGHPIPAASEAATRSDFEKLQLLIGEHDVIFLLMDTRESRWLPTVMGKATGKIVMNAALGFDTFVVMRHGVRQAKDDDELGCYFCNDVVAPADSVKDQTLDQQCTVTRPGIAAIASALLVELLVSILQHPDGAKAPAPKPGVDSAEQKGEHPLGLVPHQIRGFLSSFSNMSIWGKSYDCCSACSRKVVDEYQREGWDFVKKALNERGYVEELSGLAEVQRRAEELAGDVDWDEGGDLEDEGEGVIL